MPYENMFHIIVCLREKRLAIFVISVADIHVGTVRGEREREKKERVSEKIKNLSFVGFEYKSAFYWMPGYKLTRCNPLLNEERTGPNEENIYLNRV